VNLLIPQLIFLIGGIEYPLYLYITYPGNILAALPGLFIGSIVGCYLLWFFVAGLFYLITYFLNGTGTFVRCLEAIGYGFLPVFIYLIASQIIPISWVYSLRFIMVILPFLFLLWSAYCWIYGIKHARNLSLRNATFCVGVPVIICIILIVVTNPGILHAY
jgi:hypothetical protein